MLKPGKKLTAFALSAIIILSSLLAGCDYFSIPEQVSEPASTAVSSSSAQASNPTSAQTDNEAADKSSAQTTAEASSAAATDNQAVKNQVSNKTYTMADIKKLKNTENFAKSTLEHIFDGTINSKGKATGYHYSMVTDSKGSIIDGTRSKEDGHGVFTAKVEVDGVKKNGFSSFYPESWSPQQIVDAINTAYNDALSSPDNPQGSLWIGYCDDLEIDMYLNDSKKITTAFPIYEGE